MTYACAAATHGICINQDGSLDPCCQYRRDQVDGYVPVQFTDYTRYQETVVASMLQDAAENKPHAGCSKCYKEEDAGLFSLRQYFNQSYSQDSSDKIYHVELRPGNFCNLKCIMCSPIASSSLQVEYKQFETKYRSFGLVDSTSHVKYWEDPEYDRFIDDMLTHAQAINITGGEPLIIPQVDKVLDQLLNKQNRPRLHFNTNLTILKDQIIQKLANFDRVHMAVSLEGTEKINDYVRYPSKWNDIVSNIKKVKTHLPNTWLSANHTVQHSSMYALPDLAEFCYEQQINLYFTTVHGFDYLKLTGVPLHVKSSFAEWVKTTEHLPEDSKNFLLNLVQDAEFDASVYNRYKQYLNLIDSIRGTNHREVFTY